MRIIPSTCCFLLWAGAIAGTVAAAPQGSSPVQEQVFFVGAATSLQMLGDVRVSIIGPDKGSRPLGETNEFGRITFPRTVLQEEPHGVIVFCRQGFFCGAFPVEDLPVDKSGARLIHLAPFAVR